MPINLDDIDLMIAAAKTKSAVKGPKPVLPTYFSSVLTGQGKSTGLLNAHFHPGGKVIGASSNIIPTSQIPRKSKTTQGTKSVSEIPIAPLHIDTLKITPSGRITLPVPDDTERLEITAHATKLPYNVYASLTPQGAVFYEDTDPASKMRKVHILYRMEVYVTADPSVERLHLIDQPGGLIQGEFTMVDWSYTPLDDIVTLIARATSHFAPNGKSVFVDTGDLRTWMDNYSVFENISKQAKIWAGDEIGDIVSTYIQEIHANGATPSDRAIEQLVRQIRRLDDYTVSLNSYKRVYSTIMSTMAPDQAEMMTKQNLNLLMNFTLDDLDKNRNLITVPPTPATPRLLPAHFSRQQTEAIQTRDPFVLTQAGAGTGKTTTILERLEELKFAGVNMARVLSLSFTNAAADNIKERNPDVNAMTIAAMIHDIYRYNHPTHELSTMDTLINSIDIFYEGHPNHDFAKAFQRRLIEAAKDGSRSGGTTVLNAFVEAYYDEVVLILDTVRQVTLELEIIMAYQRISTMALPAHTMADYLIVDEVQDNSIFEFIYILKYASMNKANLYIVGDCAQTLFEFRAANPRALNALERSGVFKTYQLTTNYRSNQEILDFANTQLRDIAANDVAQIQLYANSLDEPTLESFDKAVTLNYLRYQSDKDYTDDLPGLIHVNIAPFIQKALNKGEQTALIAYSRREAKVLEEQARKDFPNASIVNIISDKGFDSTAFSGYIKRYWNDIKQVAPDLAPLTFSKDLLVKLPTYDKGHAKTLPHVTRVLSNWWIKQSATITNWVHQFQYNQITRDEFFELLRDNILTWEIDQNSIRQSMLSKKNNDRKVAMANAKPDIIISTIHGVKGLEFENVVVLHNYSSDIPEERKRLYYVAFTRAQKALYVLSHGSIANPKVTSDLELLRTGYAERDMLREQMAIRDGAISAFAEKKMTPIEIKLWVDEQIALLADKTGNTLKKTAKQGPSEKPYTPVERRAFQGDDEFHMWFDDIAPDLQEEYMGYGDHAEHEFPEPKTPVQRSKATQSANLDEDEDDTSQESAEGADQDITLEDILSYLPTPVEQINSDVDIELDEDIALSA